MNAAIDRSPQALARAGGVIYLAIILLGLFGEVAVRGSLVVPGNPAATLDGIAASQGLWRAGIAGDLLMQVLDLPLIVILYVLLRPVSRDLSLTAAGINLIQTAVLVANKMTLLVPLFLLRGGAHRLAFSPEQVQALSSLAITAHGYGFAIGLVFFGFTCLIQGYLIHRSGYLPKAIGILMAVAGACYLANSFALLLAPSIASVIFPAILVPAFVGEMSLCLWMIFKGVDLARWRERMS